MHKLGHKGTKKNVYVQIFSKKIAVELPIGRLKKATGRHGVPTGRTGGPTGRLGEAMGGWLLLPAVEKSK